MDKTLGHSVYLLVIQGLFFSWELPIYFQKPTVKNFTRGIASHVLTE